MVAERDGRVIGTVRFGQPARRRTVVDSKWLTARSRSAGTRQVTASVDR